MENAPMAIPLAPDFDHPNWMSRQSQTGRVWVLEPPPAESHTKTRQIPRSLRSPCARPEGVWSAMRCECTACPGLHLSTISTLMLIHVDSLSKRPWFVRHPREANETC